MEILNDWKFWAIFYLISSVTFSQNFKKANRNMKDASALAVLLELSTAFFALLFIPIFSFTFPTDINIYIVLLVVVVIYAATDRLNIEARYGLDPSVFSMLKQLSTVFLMIFGFIFLKEELHIKKLIGAGIIIIANFILTFDNGKIKINKYFLMCFLSNFLFALAMLINVDISDRFNLALYTFTTVFFPALIISLFAKLNIKKLKKEFKRYDKPRFILSGFCWALMLISSVRAYQLGNVTVVAPILTLTAILNTIYEYFVVKNRKNFKQKLVASILIIIGVLLIRGIL